MLKLPKPPNNFGMQSVWLLRLLFSKIESDKVFKILKHFDESKAPGIDDLSGIFLKDGVSLLATPIPPVCNLSISSGRFPDACKTATLNKLFRKGSKTDPKNYRPISLLPFVSKERIVHEQYLDPWSFLTNTAFYTNFNQDFEKIILPNFCLSYLTDRISKGLDFGLLTGVILIDLQKAFDTIDHNILLLKMPSFGFSREVIDWL